MEDVGSLLYQAPEMLQLQEYDDRVDVWSLGCIIYSMINKDCPFWASNEKLLIEAICERKHKPLDSKIS